MTAKDWNWRSVLKSCVISRTRCWKGSLWINSAVDFWYHQISRKATVLGLYLWLLLLPGWPVLESFVFLAVWLFVAGVPNDFCFYLYSLSSFFSHSHCPSIMAFLAACSASRNCPCLTAVSILARWSSFNCPNPCSVKSLRTCVIMLIPRYFCRIPSRTFPNFLAVHLSSGVVGSWGSPTSFRCLFCPVVLVTSRCSFALASWEGSDPSS